MMVCLSLYASGVGVLSNRQMAQACERTLAFVALGGEERPDVRPSAIFVRCLWRPVLRSLGRCGGEGEAGQGVDRWDDKAGRRGTKP